MTFSIFAEQTIVRQQEQQQEALRFSVRRIKKLYKAGNYAATILACNQALTVDMTNAEIYLLRGLATGNLGDAVGAVNDIRQAATFDGQ